MRGLDFPKIHHYYRDILLDHIQYWQKLSPDTLCPIMETSPLQFNNPHSLFIAVKVGLSLPTFKYPSMLPINLKGLVWSNFSISQHKVTLIKWETENNSQNPCKKKQFIWSSYTNHWDSYKEGSIDGI